MAHVVGPLSLIRLTFDMSEFAEAMSTTQIPSAFIRCTVSEVHGASAMTEATEPLSIVGGSRGAVSVLAHFKRLCQLGLVCVE